MKMFILRPGLCWHIQHCVCVCVYIYTSFRCILNVWFIELLNVHRCNEDVSDTMFVTPVVLAQ